MLYVCASFQCFLNMATTNQSPPFHLWWCHWLYLGILIIKTDQIMYTALTLLRVGGGEQKGPPTSFSQ